MRTRLPTRLPARILLPALFVAVTVAVFASGIIPYQRDVIAVWAIVGLLCFSVTDLAGSVRGIVLEWVPFMAILIAYDTLRGAAGHVASVHYLPQIQFDRWLFDGHTPTVVLQRWLWHGHVTWFDVAMWCVYLTHFFATPILAAVLWKRDRPAFRVFAVLVTTLSALGLLTYALYPAAPPWMASQRGLIAPITRIIPAVFSGLHTHSAGSIIEHGYQYANNVAAVPSLHTAFALLIAITLWRRVPRWLRPVLVVYPLAMAFALVYTGEHYVFDVVLGWAYCIAAVFVSRALLAWWVQRREPRQIVAEPA